MHDLSIVYYTANFAPESFVSKIRKNLLEAKGDIPLISVSQKPIDFGHNICVGEIGRHHLNIYKQALIGAKVATTKYIAMAEDDVLYHPSHFELRPDPGKFGYNLNYWGLYTWTVPLFSYRNRRNFHTLICERELFIEAMEERFNKWPDESKIDIAHWAEPGRYEGAGHLGVTVRVTEDFYSDYPNVVFSHPEAMQYLTLGKKKRMGDVKAVEIPHWGRAEEVLKIYHQ